MKLQEIQLIFPECCILYPGLLRYMGQATAIVKQLYFKFTSLKRYQYSIDNKVLIMPQGYRSTSSRHLSYHCRKQTGFSFKYIIYNFSFFYLKISLVKIHLTNYHLIEHDTPQLLCYENKKRSPLYKLKSNIFCCNHTCIQLSLICFLFVCD